MTEKRQLLEIEISRQSHTDARGQVFYQEPLFGQVVTAADALAQVAGRALDLAAVAARAQAYATASKAPSTRRAYALDWEAFVRWCDVHRLTPLPADPGTVALYLAAEAERLAVATLRRRLATIAQAHLSIGADNPCTARRVTDVFAGVTRTEGTQQRRKTPLVIDALRAALDACGDDLRGHRDRALLLLGYAGALRRSELVAVAVEDLAEHQRGYVLTIRRSKTDQTGEGRIVGIPHGSAPEYSPPAAIRSWMTWSGVTSGPLLRGVDRTGHISRHGLNGRTVANVVQRVCLAAGLQGDYSGHSLRAGLATSAAAAGASEMAIMSQTGHKSASMMRRYVRPVEIWEHNAAALAGL